jgi:hypothetical protein
MIAKLLIRTFLLTAAMHLQIPLLNAQDTLVSVIDVTGHLEVAAGEAISLAVTGDVTSVSSADEKVAAVALSGSSKRVAVASGIVPGTTTITFAIDQVSKPVSYTIRVTPNMDARRRKQEIATELATFISLEYPSSKVTLTVAPTGKLLLRGEVPDQKTGANIVELIKGELFSVDQIVNEMRIPHQPCSSGPTCSCLNKCRRRH